MDTVKCDSLGGIACSVTLAGHCLSPTVMSYSVLEDDPPDLAEVLQTSSMSAVSTHRQVLTTQGNITAKIVFLDLHCEHQS